MYPESQDLNKDLNNLDSSGVLTTRNSPPRVDVQVFRPYPTHKAGLSKTQYTPLNRSGATNTQSSQQPGSVKQSYDRGQPSSTKKVILKTSKKTPHTKMIRNIKKRQSESPQSHLEVSNMTVSAKLQSSMRNSSHIGSSKKGVINSASPLRFKLQNNAYQNMENASKTNESGEEYCWTTQNRQNVKIDLYAFKKNLLNWDDIEGILKKRFGQKVPRDLKENMHNLYLGLLPLTARDQSGQNVNKFKYMQLILDQKLIPSEQRKNIGMAAPSTRHKIASVNPRPMSSPNNLLLSIDENIDSTAQNQDIIEQLNGNDYNNPSPISKFNNGRKSMMPPGVSFDTNKRGEQVKMIDLIERRLPSSQESLAFDSSELVIPQQQDRRAPTPRYQMESKNNGRESYNRTSSRNNETFTKSRGSQDPSPKGKRENISVDIKPAHERIPSFQGINLNIVNHFLNNNRIELPEAKIKQCYRAMASNGQTMNKKEFNKYLVVLQDEYVMAKQAEIKHKLREMRNLFEQPNVNLGNAPTSLQQILDKESPVKSKSPKRKTRLPQLISFDQESSQQAIAQKLIIEIDKIMVKNQYMANQDNSQKRDKNIGHAVDNSWRTKLTPKIQSVGKLHPLLEYYDTLQEELEELQKHTNQSMTKILDPSMSWEKTPLKQQGRTIQVQHAHRLTPSGLNHSGSTARKMGQYTPKGFVAKGSLPVTHEKSKLPKNIEKRPVQTSPKARLNITPPENPVNHNVIKYQERLAKIKAAKEKKLAGQSPSPNKFRSQSRQLPKNQLKYKTIDMEQFETEHAYEPSNKRSASRDFCNKSVRPSYGRGQELTEGTQTDLNQSSSKRLQEKKIKYSIDEMILNQQFIQKIVSDDSSDDNHTMNLGNYSEARHDYPKRNQSIEQEPFIPMKKYVPPKMQVQVAQTPKSRPPLKFDQNRRSPQNNKKKAHVVNNNKNRPLVGRTPSNQIGMIVTKCKPEYGEIKHTRQLYSESFLEKPVNIEIAPVSKIVQYEKKKMDMIPHQQPMTVMHQGHHINYSSDAWCQDNTNDRTLENFMRAGTPSKKIAFRPISRHSRLQQNRSPREYIQPPQPSSSARRPYTPTPQFESKMAMINSRFEPEGSGLEMFKSDYNHSQVPDSQINFKQKIQQMRIVEKPQELQEEIVFTEMDPHLELMSHDTLSVRNPNNKLDQSRLSNRISSINNNKNIPERLEDIIIDTMNINLSNEKAVQIHLENQGFQMFEQQKYKISSIQARSYNKNSEDFKNQIEILNEEKFENDEVKDVTEWQTHDRFKHVQGGNIESSILPLYIKESLNKAPFRRNAYVLFDVQCGQKMGQKITDVDTRWVEKWYDVQCRSNLPNRPQETLIIKYYSKFWTNLLKNTIDGESCMKILTVDNKVQYELHEQLEMNNIFNKKNPRGIQSYEKLMPNDQVSRKLQNKWNNHLQDDMQLFNDTIQEHSIRKVNSRFSNTPSTSTNQVRKVFKSPMKKAMMQKEKFASQHTNPFDNRFPKLTMIRTNLSEFDHRGEKVKEFGVEHRWQSENSTVFETTTWNKNHLENDIKHNVVLTETNKLNQMTADSEYKTGKREGTNEFGQTWKEDWAVHAITGHQKWTKVYSEPKHLRQDGFSSRWGEWREESPAQNQNHGEKWTEISKEDGYHERRSEKYTEYADPTKKSSMVLPDQLVKKILIIGDGQGIINKVSGKSKQPKNGFQIKLLDNSEGEEKFYAWEITGKYDKKLLQSEQFDGIIWVINSNYDLKMLKKSKDELYELRQTESLQKVPLLLFANGLDKKVRAPEEIANILELRFIHERVWNIKSAAQGVQNSIKWLQQTILTQITQQTSLKRSGVNTFSNSDKKLIVEHWEEFKDGTLIKNIYEDDGKGKKMLKKNGIKLDLELLEDVEMVSDQYGFFKHFKTSTYTLETEVIKSLQSLIERHREYLEWDYSNQIMEYFGLNKVTTVKKGKDYKNQQEWNCLREYYLGEEAELVTNYGKDAEGEWKEQWHKNKLGESWAKKEGHSQGKQWFEEWYLKVNEKEDMLESKSDKWAKNDLEEWHEKWGESHIPGNKFKWFDKWQINLLNGQRQGEKWSQKYNDDYTVKEHCNEKWDHNGIYEQSHY